MERSMGYETKVYVARMSDHRNDAQDVTPKEYKDLFKKGVKLHSAITARENSDEAWEDPVWKAKYDKWFDFQNEHFVWGQIVAMVEMCKMGVIGESNPTGYNGYIPYIFGSDGNSVMIEDPYGSPMEVHTVENYLEAAKEASKECDYRRWPILINLLEGFITNKDAWGEDIRVLTYGH
jgi:hypothetical protein